MRKYRKLYIIIVVAYAALLVVSRIYSVSSFLVDIVYLLVGLSYYSLRLGNNIMLKKMIKRKK